MKSIIMLSLFALTWASLLGQSKATIEAHVNQLLEEYDENQPGLIESVIKDGEIVYQKAIGLAELDSGTKINAQTIFPLEDIGKQFTVYALLCLIDNGKVSLNDDIRKYIPQLPEYEHVIRVKHVLNHTTGLSDFKVMTLLLGGSMQSISQSEALNLIASQKSLDNIPGDKFSMYDSDTEPLLMAEIIKSASGVSLAEYARQNVFVPLGMKSTSYLSDTEIKLSKAARSYQQVEDKHILNSYSIRIEGPSNLWTSAEDFALWNSYLSPKNKDLKYELIKKLDTPVTNSDGEVYHSSWGEMTMGRSFWHLERGIPIYWQFGLVAGYGNNVFRFPDQDAMSFVLGNNNSYNGFPAMMSLRPYLENDFKLPEHNTFETVTTIAVTTKKLKEYEGDYYLEEAGASRRIAVRDDTLRYYRGERESNLMPIAEDKFQLEVMSDDILVLDFNISNGDKYYLISSGGSSPYRYDSFQKKTISSADLLGYEGTYMNKEIGVIFTAAIENDQLTLQQALQESIIFSHVKQDTFQSASIPLSSIKFQRENGQIIGFQIEALGIHDMQFEKVITLNL